MAVNLVYGTSNSTAYAIKQANTVNLDNLANYVLEVMAAGTYTGSLTADTSPGASYTTIGTFQDTKYVNAPGSGDLTITSTFYNVSQIQSATLGAQSDPPQYLGLSSNSTVTSLQANLTSISDLADDVLARMIATSPTYGINSFYLGATAPADGGTWATVGTGVLVDNLNGTQVNGNYYIWKKLSGAATTTLTTKPMKLDASNSNRPTEFSLAETQAIIKTIEQRIVATGIGTYTLATTAPGTGTWSAMGTVTDTISTTIPTTYVGDDTTNYLGTTVNTTNYTGPPGFAGFAAFAGADVAYSGPPLDNTQYSGFASFSGFAQFAGTVGFDYQTYQGNDYSRDIFYGPTPPTYFGPNFAYFLGPAYTADYVGPGGTYLTDFTAQYRNIQPGAFSSFTATAASYQGTFVNFGTPYTLTFFSPAQYQSLQSYLGPANYTGPGPASYLGGATYLSPATYGQTAYLGPADVAYLGPTNYDGTGIANYASTAGAGGTLTLYRRVA